MAVKKNKKTVNRSVRTFKGDSNLVDILQFKKKPPIELFIIHLYTYIWILKRRMSWWDLASLWMKTQMFLGEQSNMEKTCTSHWPLDVPLEQLCTSTHYLFFSSSQYEWRSDTRFSLSFLLLIENVCKNQHCVLWWSQWDNILHCCGNIAII